MCNLEGFLISVGLDFLDLNFWFVVKNLEIVLWSVDRDMLLVENFGDEVIMWNEEFNVSV